MIKSYNCTDETRTLHLLYTFPKCRETLNAFIAVIKVLDQQLNYVEIIEQQLQSISSSKLRLAGSVILTNYNYTNLGLQELYEELLTRGNISTFILANSTQIIEFLNKINSDKYLKSILVGKPRLLELLNDKLISEFQFLTLDNGQFNIELKNIIRKVFHYDSFKNSGVWTASKLQIQLNTNYCLYCNLFKLPTTGYAFDHCIPQTEFPLFSISLFNLIPSCTNCNTNNKGSTPFYTFSHIHPYHCDYLNQYNFEIDYQNNILNIRGSTKTYSIDYKCIDPSISTIIQNSFNDLSLLKEYNHHKGQIDNYLEIIYFYNVDYVKSVVSFINNRGEPVTLDALYKALFNVELSEQKFCFYSHSRLIYDLCLKNKVMENLSMALE